MRAEMGKDPSRAPPSQLNLPPGFRFYPTDEELCVHYLCKKAASEPFAIPIIAEVELYKFDPWDLPERALFGEKEWYFFSPRDRKYPNGSRPNRAAGTGYWKATGTDKPIHTMGGIKKVGVKKALVFYKGKAPKGVKTNWIMHEYRLADSGVRSAKKKGTLRLDDWVLCRIYKKCSGGSQKSWGDTKEQSESSCLDNVVSPTPHSSDERHSPNLGGIQEGACDDKRTVSLHDLYQGGRAYPTVNAASDYSFYTQQLQGRMYDQAAPAPAPAGAAPNHNGGIGLKIEHQGASSADVSNTASPSNVHSSRHTSETSAQEEDAAESTFVSLPSFSAEQLNTYQPSLYGLDAGLPSPSSMLGQGSFANLLEADYASLFASSEYNLPTMRPFSRAPHLSWDPNKINNYAT